MNKHIFQWLIFALRGKVKRNTNTASEHSIYKKKKILYLSALSHDTTFPISIPIKLSCRLLQITFSLYA